jgi:hypothetical protein
MKASLRPLSQKRVAEGLLGRVLPSQGVCSVAGSRRRCALLTFLFSLRVSLGQFLEPVRESVLFIGTQFSILYTFMYSPA